MKIIISPAKKLNINNKLDEVMKTDFISESMTLVDSLRNKSVNDIKKLMKLSDDLAKTNWQRFQCWDIDNKKTYHPIFMFNGDVFQGIDAYSLNDEDISLLQQNLRIISGLYGLLKPLDYVLPYRLEMGVKMNNVHGDNLYDFWGKKLRDALISEMPKEEVLINLASNEYSKAIHLDSFSRKVITPVFKDYKNGKLKTISFFAKKARGRMVNFIIKNKISNISDLKLFNDGGYSYNQGDKGEILFIR